MKQLTASALPRAFKCLASILLPQEDYRTEYADQGHERHGEMETSIVAGDLSAMPQKVQELVEGMTVRAEVAVVYDAATRTARELGSQLGRSYGTLKPFETPGTIDMLAVGNGRVVVGDWKGYELVDEAERNRQTKLYALAAAAIYGVSEVTVCIAHLSRGDRAVDVAVLDGFDLDSYALELQQLHVDAAKAAPDPHAHERPGSHCKYCPSFLACKTQKALAEQAKTNELASRINALIPFENDDEAADAYELAEKIGMLLTRLRGSLAARAKERPIPLHNGRMYGEVEKLGNRALDGDKAYEIVRAKYGQAVADAAVKREASQKGIETALKNAGVTPFGPAKEAVLQELADRGGITRKRSVVLDEYDAQQPQLKAANQ